MHLSAIQVPGQKDPRRDDMHCVDVLIRGRFSENTRTFSLPPSYRALSTTVVPIVSSTAVAPRGDQAVGAIPQLLSDVREYDRVHP
ncbi:MAG: hypothetical protein NVSMB43_26390 [Pseudarthrobacter sp.]